MKSCGPLSPLLALLALLALTPGADAQTVADPADAQQRDAFRVAFEQARAGRSSSIEDSPELRRHPLYPYLLAERIAAELADASDARAPADERAAEFIASNEGEPVAWQLRYAWLTSLERREQWETLLAEYRDDYADERLSCRYLEARIALERLEGIAPAIVTRWLTPRQLPGECEPVFQWLRDEGALTDDHVEQRVVLLLGTGQPAFARVIAGRLPQPRAAPYLQWAALIERPRDELVAYVANPDPDIDPRALADAWRRLSRDDPAAALNLYATLRDVQRPDESTAAALALDLALGLAWDRRREALDFFDIAATAGLDDYALEWRTRAALWAGEWALADASIAAMSPQQRELTRWRYWSGRVTELREGRSDARDAYVAALADDNYYSGLAAARLRRRLQPNVDPLPRDTAIVAGLASRAAFVRARELLAIGLPAAALREWRYGFAQLDLQGQQQSIHLAADWQWYDLAVSTATRFGVFNDYDLLYPRPYGGEVLAAVESSRLATDLVYGVIRQESLYRADAVSGAGARGLMQLRPGTAVLAARRLDDPDMRGADLLDPAVNIRLGTAQLGHLLERFDGNLAVALAAYNAGPAAAERWLPPTSMGTDVWLENVPFNETRGYVQRVLWHTLVFRWLETGRPQDTRDWLERVSPAPDRE
jgi:soluble lytic murein transglycosylase